MLKNLMEIASVVTSNGVSMTEILAESRKEDALLLQFLRGIIERRWSNDEEAEAELYAGSHKEEAYRVLKHRAKRKLLSFLFKLNPPDTDIDRNRAMFYKAIVYVSSAQILMSSSAVAAAIELFEQAYSLAEEYEIWHVGIVAADYLESSYALSGYTERHERAAANALGMRESLAAERKGKKLFYEFTEIVNSTADYSGEIQKNALRLVGQLKKLAEKHPTNALIKQSLRAAMVNAMMRKEYSTAVELALQGLKHLDENPRFQTATLRLEYNMQLSYCLLELRRFQEAKVHSDLALRYAVPQSTNWSVAQGNAVLLALRMEDWQNAATLLQDLMRYSAGMKGHEFRKEKFLLYHGYFSYLVQSGLIKTTRTMLDVAAMFNGENLLSHSPITTRDKQGANIARVILQVLLMLAQGNVVGVNTKAESLRQYRQTYLKESRYSRSAAFMKLLHLLLENEYNVGEVQRKGEKYARLLQPSPENNGGCMEGIEPILLEQLWEYVLLHVKKLQAEGVILPSPPKRKKYNTTGF